MLRRFMTAIRQWADGVTRPTYGCCSGDPIATEKEAERHFREREAIRNVHVAHTHSPAPQNTPADGRRPTVSQ
jgi:hypothetical protein